MESYPIWIRVHPDSLDETMAISVQARMHDPLWLLGRQWQLGELRHDAGATPIDVRVDGTSAPIARMRGGPADATGGPYVTVSPKAAPLETIVEREAVSEAGLDGLRLRTEAGLHLLRLLRAAGLTAQAAAWVTRCPFALPAGTLPDGLDEETRDWWDLVDGRIPDAVKLRVAVPAALKPAAGTAPVPEPEAGVVRVWLAWCGSRFDVAARGTSTWNPERFEYSFAVSGLGASGEVVLAAPEYIDGRLDWFDFEQSRRQPRSDRAAAQRRFHRDPCAARFCRHAQPTLLDIRRSVDAIRRARAAVASGHAAIACHLDGARLRAELRRRLVPGAARDGCVDSVSGHRDRRHRRLRRYRHRESPGRPLEPLPPRGRNDHEVGPVRIYVNATPAEAVEGPPLEELHFLRDEVANVAWAVERLIPHPLNHGVEPPDVARTVGAAGPTGLVWTLAPPSPPRNWFPLLPLEIGRLALGVLWSARDARPAGTLLTELRASKRRLHQEEVPNEGAQVTRRWQSARGIDGSLHFWIGRSKTPRKTDIAPALRFDLVEWR